MAATRLIPLHQGKGKTIAECLKERTDYTENKEKTEDGKYIDLAVQKNLSIKALV